MIGNKLDNKKKSTKKELSSLAKKKYLPSEILLFKEKAKLTRHKTIKQKLHRYVYRYRFARSFNGIVVEDIGLTKTGYESGMRIFLAYTTYELLVETAYRFNKPPTRHITTNQVIDIELADKVRLNKKLMNFLNDSTKDFEQKKELDKFINSENHSIALVAFLIRNAYAHGDFTAGGMGLMKQEECNVIDNMTVTLLDYCDDIFSKCVELL
jgi:hypothetical protein